MWYRVVLLLCVGFVMQPVLCGFVRDSLFVQNSALKYMLT